MKNIGLIAMDMDGTLLNSQQQISAANVAALREAEAAGVKLAICSGRAPGDNALFALENGLKACAILSLNGAYCLEAPTAPAFANHLMDDATARRSIEWLREADVSFGCFAQNRIGIFESPRHKEPITWGSHVEGPMAPEYFFDREALEKALTGGLNKIVCIDSDTERLRELCEKLQQLELLDVTSSWPNNLELMPKGIGKGNAVRELAERLGLTARQVMTLGDYDNDLSMMTYAGWSVAMGNASPAVNSVARFKTLTNDEDGVADAIRRLVLP